MKKRFMLLFALLMLLPVMALAELNYEVKNTHYIYFPDLHQMTAHFQDAENWIFVTPENLEEHFDMVLARGGTEEEIRQRLEKIEQGRQYSFPVQVTVYALIAASFTLFFGGNGIDMVASAIMGIFLKLLERAIRRFRFSHTRSVQYY